MDILRYFYVKTVLQINGKSKSTKNFNLVCFSRELMTISYSACQNPSKQSEPILSMLYRQKWRATLIKRIAIAAGWERCALLEHSIQWVFGVCAFSGIPHYKAVCECVRFVYYAFKKCVSIFNARFVNVDQQQQSFSLSHTETNAFHDKNNFKIFPFQFEQVELKF